MMENHGVVRVAVANPVLRLADPKRNADEILQLLSKAALAQVHLVVFPELCLTGYTCGDLFQQRALLDATDSELIRLARQSGEFFKGVVVVSAPLRSLGRLYDTAIVIAHGEFIGVVPKTYLPNYGEFYEQRWFHGARGDEAAEITIADRTVPFGTDLLFASQAVSALVLGVEICEDLWVPEPPSGKMALAGATLFANPSASNEGIAKADYRRQLVLGQSARCVASYLYASSGVHESTTDVVFGGHGIIAENGALLAESVRFARGETLTIADLDLERIQADRQRLTSFVTPGISNASTFRWLTCPDERAPTEGLRRPVPAHPFVPSDPARLAERCEEIFQIQIAGLARRLEVARPPRISLGVSGGLDSTLALLVAVKTLDLLGWPRTTLDGLTMPGFGTSDRTRSNAFSLLEYLKVSSESVDIRPLCLNLFRAIGHRPFGINVDQMGIAELTEALATIPSERRHDLVFENVQARTRTLMLMSRGFVLGTGDLSELALGWCTYNGDHISMYNVNASIPKTLVRFLVRWAADHQFDEPARSTLHSIADTEISPELLPLGNDQQIQSTEDSIGPYELHDFFLYHFIRFGFSPSKIWYLARHATFDRNYSAAEILDWLKVFVRRFVASQYKRSCVPDGPKVGSISLSPRGDWRMPSDAAADLWLREIERLENRN